MSPIVNSHLDLVCVAGPQSSNTTASSGTLGTEMYVHECTITGGTESIERGNKRGDSFSDNPVVEGQWTATASISKEIRTNGTAGQVPEDDMLWLSTLGSKLTGTATAVSSGASSTTFDVDTPGNLNDNQIILIGVGGGNTMEVTRITDISSNTITVSPALSTTPSASDTVYASITYVPSTSNTSLYTIERYINSYLYQQAVGSKVNTAELTFEMGAIGKVSFSLEAIYINEQIGAPDFTASYDTQKPGVDLASELKYDGTAKNFKSFSVSIGNNLERHTLSNSLYGTSDLLQGKRNISGTIAVQTPSDATTYFDAARDKSGVELLYVIGVKDSDNKFQEGQTVAVCVPECSLSEITRDEGSAMMDTLNWKAYSTAAEEDIFIAFL